MAKRKPCEYAFNVECVQAWQPRNAALSALKLPEAAFIPIEQADEIGGEQLPGFEPREFAAASPANELVITLVELDIAEAVRANAMRPSEVPETATPLAQRHLETVERIVEHLKSEEMRLHEEIADAKRQLADTQLTRRGYEHNGAELRKGIAQIAQRATAVPPPSRQPRSAKTRPSKAQIQAKVELGVSSSIAVLKPRRGREMH